MRTYLSPECRGPSIVEHFRSFGRKPRSEIPAVINGSPSDLHQVVITLEEV